MRYRLLTMLTVVLLTGCVVHHPRVSRGLDVPEAPEIAFARAVKATMAVQGTIHQQDVKLGMINATVQQAVSLNVLIAPQGSGSRIAVAHQVAATHVAFGTVTLVDDWIAAYHRQQ